MPSAVITGSPPERSITIPLGLPLGAIEEQVIRKTLKEVTSRREKAAEILGISARALHYKLRQYQIE